MKNIKAEICGETFPGMYAICCNCSGHGTVDRLGAIKEADRADPDFMRDYLAGVYDRACSKCGGTGKVIEVNVDILTYEQLENYNACVEAEIEIEAERQAEERYFYGLDH